MLHHNRMGVSVSKYVLKDKGKEEKIVGLGTPDELSDECQSMIDVLLDRTKSPVDNGSPLGLLTVANAYLARAREMEFLIYRLEREGVVRRTPRSVDMAKADPYYTFRTGELAAFIQIAEKAVELGSRRLTAARLEFDRSVRGLE